MTYSSPTQIDAQAQLYAAGLARLSASSAAEQDGPMAVMAMSLAADEHGWQQLLPAGHFRAIDGRPFDVPGGQWFINEAIANRLIAQHQAAANDLVIDYEHQTLNTNQNGQPAPAAGWFAGSDIQWRESGLWVRPRWTDRARDFIKSAEYKFLSAVFPYDKQTGEPLYLHSAALVNRAGIDGLKALTALNAQHKTHSQEKAMNELIKKLLAKIGIELAEGALPTEAQATAALSALDTVVAQAGRATGMETELATLKAKSPGAGDIDLSKYVPVATYNGLVTELAALKAGTDQATAEQLIADARKDGKILAAEEDYLASFGKQQGVAALKALIDTRPSLTALSATQTHGKKPENDGKDSLTTEQLAVCKAMDLAEDAYRAALKTG